MPRPNIVERTEADVIVEITDRYFRRVYNETPAIPTGYAGKYAFSRMKYIAAILLLLFSAFSLAETVTAESKLAWEYPEEADGSLPNNVDGFQIFANGEKVWTGTKKLLPVSDLNLAPGRYEIHVVAYNIVDVSGPSNTVTPTLVTVGPAIAPLNLIIVSQ